MHLQTNEMSRRIGNDVSLAPLDLLASIITAGTATFRRFHRLAVDDTRGRARLPTLVLARHDDERVVDRHPRPIARPRIEIALHGRVRRKLFWKLPPLATRRSDVEQCIHDLTDVRLAWTSDRIRNRHERLDQRPLRIRRVACVAKAFPPIMQSSDLSPGHRVTPSILAKPIESQPAEITQLFFSQPLSWTLANFRCSETPVLQVFSHGPGRARDPLKIRCTPIFWDISRIRLFENWPKSSSACLWPIQAA